MKKYTLSIVMGCALILSSCASYTVTIMDDKGATIAQHKTAKVYVGTGAFVPDAILDPLVMVYSLFVPQKIVRSSTGEGGGMSLSKYINKMAGLAPVPFVGEGSSPGKWVVFHDDKKKVVTYKGYNYKLERDAFNSIDDLKNSVSDSTSN